MANTEIKKVVLRVGGVEVELSLKEVHELRSILNETFSEKAGMFRPFYPYYPHGEPYWKPYDQWSYTTSNTGSSDVLYLSNAETSKGCACEA